MSIPTIYSFSRYLSAKQTVDDRALNQGVWSSLAEALPPDSREQPLRVLEAGCGIGTMLERMAVRGLLRVANYTGLDSLGENIETAWKSLEPWAGELGLGASPGVEGAILADANRRLSVNFLPVDLFEFIRMEGGRRNWDLLVAHAFLDLLDIPAALPQLFGLLRPGGLFYLTLNFDGVTLFEPVIDPALDERIVTLYHRSMDERITAGKRSGDSRAGRHLFAQIQRAGGQVLASGSSDWVVFPQEGAYPADEAYFLHTILHFFEETLGNQPELDPGEFRAWLAKRRAQVERGELVYIAHQLDFMGAVTS